MTFILLPMIAFVFMSNLQAHSNLKEDIPSNLILENDSSLSDIGYDNCDPETNGEYFVLKFLLEKASIVFDVGAAQGDWSRQALSVNENIKIHAFEPLAEQAKKLTNKFSTSSMTVYSIAIGSDVATSKFYVCSQVADLSSLHVRPVLKDQFNFSLEEREVPMDTIDSVSNKINVTNIDFLKIDTEGNELAVFRGSVNLLQRKAINAIQFEYGASYEDSKTTLKEVYNFLKLYGYSIFRITAQGLIHISQWEDALENYRYSNYLAVPN